MSEFSDQLEGDCRTITAAAWQSRNGQVVPETDDLRLSNDRVALGAVFLYADLADSTELVLANKEIAAEIFKAYLRGVSKIIIRNGGSVRSFDGDRVMGIFIDGAKNTAAVKAGMQINWFFQTALSQRFKDYYSVSLANTKLDQTVGIDASDVHAVRAGIRNSNDLIWVGRAPNVAAKLSAIQNGTDKILITAAVYNLMLDEVKMGGDPRRNMWRKLTWAAGEKYGSTEVYGSHWTWKP